MDRIRVEQGLQPGQWGEGITLSISSGRGPKRMRGEIKHRQRERHVKRKKSEFTMTSKKREILRKRKSSTNKEGKRMKAGR